MRRFIAVLSAVILLTVQTGCLGTLVTAPTRKGLVQSTTRAHIVALPTQINATVCPNGLSETFTYVPLWGLVVGFFTFGIIVPMTTQFTCQP
jgi:hypothetical protein